MLPGFGAVASFYVLNARSLAQNYRVLCVDWAGTGGSKRSRFWRKKGQDSEAYFVDACEYIAYMCVCIYIYIYVSVHAVDELHVLTT
jgi:hypothetical protein